MGSKRSVPRSTGEPDSNEDDTTLRLVRRSLPRTDAPHWPASIASIVIFILAPAFRLYPTPPPQVPSLFFRGVIASQGMA